jgi:hypothetical protein
VLTSRQHSNRKQLMPWGSTRTGAMAVELAERPYVPGARPTLFASRCLRPLINFSSRISGAREDPPRSFSVLLHLACAAGNICCNRRRGLKGIAAFCDPILPSSHGLILSECGGNQYLHRSTKRSFYEGPPYGKQEPSPPSDEINCPRHERPSAQLGIRHLLRETRYARSDRWTSKDLCFQ